MNSRGEMGAAEERLEEVTMNSRGEMGESDNEQQRRDGRK